MEHVKHENILSSMDTIWSEDKEHIVMELCAGTLGDLIYGKYQGPKVADSDDKILHQLTKGLNYLHCCTPNQIIHRDLKPDNILISIPPVEDFKPVMKLADFGYSRIASNKSIELKTVIKTSNYSEDYRHVGTKYWSAPEMLDFANATFTKASDIFPLGLIFVMTMSRGRHAFDDYDPGKIKETDDQKIQRIYKRHDRMYVTEKKERMAVKEEYFPDLRVYHLIINMLDHNPKNRPTTEKILKSFSRGKNGEPLFQFTYIDLEEQQEKENKELFDLCRRKSLDLDATKQLQELVKVDSVNVSKALLLLCENNQSESLYKGIETLLGAGKEVYISVTDKITGNNAVMFLCEKCPPQHLLSTIEHLLKSPLPLKIKKKRLMQKIVHTIQLLILYPIGQTSNRKIFAQRLGTW